MMESLLNAPIKSEISVKSEPPDRDEQESDAPIIAGLLMRKNISVVISNKVSSSSASSITSSNGKRPSDVPKKPILQLGQTFKSFNDVSVVVRIYEQINKVKLTQKYFRRIAANPKPSNKEDYSLSVEERKRFVYRWVDFCCTYFDTLNPDGEGARIGFTIKECPMRIRFQMRFKEKDLFVSIFREAHDHSHPDCDDPLQTQNRSSVVGSGSPAAVGADLSSQTPKQNLRPPPSLAPLPNRSAISRTSTSSSPSSLSTLTIRTSVSPGSTADADVQSSLPMPRPPPLKKGPTVDQMIRANQGVSGPSNQSPAGVDGAGVSSKDIIRNVYRYLLQTKLHGSNLKGGIVFTSPNPDLVKLTSEISGIDQSVVKEVLGSKRTSAQFQSNAPQKYINTASSTGSGRSNSALGTFQSLGFNIVSKRCNSNILPNSKRHRPGDIKSLDAGDEWTTHPFSNTESCDAYKKLANLPVDVSIKPDITSLYYSESEEEYMIDYEEDVGHYFGANGNGR